MCKIMGGDDVVMGYMGNIGYVFLGLMGKWFGNVEKFIEDLEIFKSLGFLCDLIVLIMILMGIVYIILVIVIGLVYIELKLSGGINYIVYVLV